MGRSSKDQGTPNRTRSIASYFFASSSPRPAPASEPSVSQPLNTSKTTEIERRASIPSTTILDNLPDPFNSSSDQEDSSSNKEAEVGSQRNHKAWENDPLAPELDSIEGFAFSSQVSRETLRRLTLSPRKPKRTLDVVSGPPMLSFTDRLAINKSYHHDIEPMIQDDKSEIVVAGSDSGSESDWNDKESLSQAEKEPSPDIAMDTTPNTDNTSDPVDPLSDEDYPNLAAFKSKIVPVALDDSDSDLEEDPFPPNAPDTAASSPAPAPAEAPHEEIYDAQEHPSERSDTGDLDMLLTEEDEVDLPVSRSGRPVRSSRAITRKPVVVIPPRPVRAKPKQSTLFSLDSLLKEKARKEKIGYNIVALKEKINLDNKLLEEYDENEEEVLVFGPEAIPRGVLSEEQEGALTEMIAEEEQQVIEDIAEFFVDWPQELNIPPLELDPRDVDRVVEKAIQCTVTDKRRAKFLTSGYLATMVSSPWSMPRQLFRWLLQVLAGESDQIVASHVFTILEKAISQKSSLLGVDCQDLANVLRMYGAREGYLSKQWHVERVTAETKSERTIFQDTPTFPKESLKAVIKLVNMTATLDPLFYDAIEIRKVISLLLRMTTDPIIGDIKSLLGTTIVALLDAIPPTSWRHEVHRICEEATQSFGTSAPFILLILKELPSLSERIVLLRRSIALAYLELPPIPAGESAPRLDDLHRALFVDRGFLVGPSTDYKALGQRVQIFGFCLDDEQLIAAYGPQALESLVRKLRLMHGKIVDVRAAFMERTMTKDIINRLLMRVYYGGVHRQTAKQTTLNFGSSAISSSAANRDRILPADLSELRLVPELASSHHSDQD